MLVANSFDLWKKDGFFSAAEQVQESADTMEFAFRTWLREKRDGLNPDDLNELRNELQTALGTTKWQLEEFEKAVGVQYGFRGEEFVLERHRQFIVAIGNQISRVEDSLRESYGKVGKQPLRWVNLNEEECNDLATFLSGTSPTPFKTKTECLENSFLAKGYTHENCEKKAAENNIASCSSSNSLKKKGSKNVHSVDIELQQVIEPEVKESSARVDDSGTLCKMDRTINARRTMPNVPDLKIVIADENQERKQPLTSVEVTRKGKSAPVLWKRGCGKFSQIFGSVQFQRQAYSPWHLQLACSVQFTLALMLTIFLIVPFMFYSA